MLIVQNCIISEDIADCQFCCDLNCCKGLCCIEGDAGAPVEKQEIPLLENAFAFAKPYMTPKGIAAVEENGVATTDDKGESFTTLIDNKDCAFVCKEGEMTFCAIEKAWRDGKIDFMKPISCHLYPIRIDEYREFTAVNYHQWDICQCAREKGKVEGTPLYKYLKEPLIRRFGEAWYADLTKECEEYLSRRKK